MFFSFTSIAFSSIQCLASRLISISSNLTAVLRLVPPHTTITPFSSSPRPIRRSDSETVRASQHQQQDTITPQRAPVITPTQPNHQQPSTTHSNLINQPLLLHRWIIEHTSELLSTGFDVTSRVRVALPTGIQVLPSAPLLPSSPSSPPPPPPPPSPLLQPTLPSHTHIMLLPKGGVTWKSAKSRLPPSRAILHFLTRTRFLVFVALAGLIILLWQGISTSASEMQR